MEGEGIFFIEGGVKITKVSRNNRFASYQNEFYLFHLYGRRRKEGINSLSSLRGRQNYFKCKIGIFSH